MFRIDTQWQDTDASVHSGPSFLYDDARDAYRYYHHWVRCMNNDRLGVAFCTVALTVANRTLVSYYKEG